MKIRTDFVTNSSSVSFIITMDLYISENYNRLEQETDTTRRKVIYDAIKEELMTGTVNQVDGHETYVKKLRIRPKTEAVFERAFDNPEAVDFASMSHEELWKYINGEYILNNRITGEYQGFSLMRLPKECPDLRSFMVVMSPCNVKMDMRKLFFRNDSRQKRILEILMEDLKSSGQEFIIDGKTVFMKTYTFDIKKDCQYEAHMPKEEDFSGKSKDELFPYIMGEYLFNRKIKAFDSFACLPVGVKAEKKPETVQA